ncbi:hypothetical protein GOP47_0010183 [Adiantum capillus-veneris]|uniref:Uncharacterized protein n=1 Tax=Adiantum capillus-veneris TaxID=13818 RepID=A0A9D4UUN9_ADICA|nr:hypothetical protein GOP47_0010183 [Adiantum capillus-veneris]
MGSHDVKEAKIDMSGGRVMQLRRRGWLTALKDSTVLRGLHRGPVKMLWVGINQGGSHAESAVPKLENMRKDQLIMRAKSGSLAFWKLFSFADSFDVLLIVLGTFGGLLAGTPLPVATFLFGRVLDDMHFGSADLHAQQRSMAETAYHAFIAGVIAAAAYFLQVTCWMNVGERQAERIRYHYLQALLRQDLSFYDQEVTTGAMVETFTVDIFHIKQATGEKVGKLVQSVGNLLSGYIIAFTQGWKLTLVACTIIPFFLFSGYAMALIVPKISRDVFAANGQASCIIEQVITAIKTVVPFGGEKKAIQVYDKALRKASRASLQQSIATGIGIGIIMFFTFGMYAYTLWFGAVFIVHGGYTGGRVITVLFTTIIGTSALGQCVPSLTAISAGTTAAHKMFEIMNRVPCIDIANESGLVLDELKGEIEFKNVSFTYPTRPDHQVFTDFSLLIPMGAAIALVGESGSGKSTVVSLIERFYDPLSGQVKIDGVDLRDLNLSWFRRQVGLVSQEPMLLHGSVRDNITYGRENAIEEEIHAAVEIANASDFIAQLPQGMDTIVGQGGLQLSGGQKQRIAIARAVLKDPHILLLDEATSSLDTKSETLVHAALDRAMQGRTTLIIAHRLTTVRDAHFIAVIQRGCIVEQGTHAELVTRTDGVFAELVQLEERRRAEQGQEQGQTVQPVEALGCHRRTGRFSSFGSSGSLGSVHNELTTEGNREASEHYQIASSVGWSHGLRLAAFNKRETPLLLLGSFAAFCNGAVLPIVGLLFTNIIRTFYGAQDDIRAGALLWIYVFIGLAVLSLLLNPLQNVCFSLAGERLVRRIRLLAFTKILHQDMKWFEHSDNASGLISSQLQRDASQMRVVVGDGLAIIAQNLTTVLVGLLIAMSTCWQLALLFIGLLPFYSLDVWMQVKLGEVFDAKAKIMYSETSQIAHDALSSIRTVASFCAEKKILSLYHAKSMECLKGGRQAALIGGLGFGATYVMMFGSLALSFWVGGKLIFSGLVDFDKFVKTFLIVELSAIAVALSLGVTPDISNVKLAVASVFKLLDLKHNELNAGMKLKRLKGEVEFQQVQFTYPMMPDTVIFSNLSFTLQAGKTLALVGQSGCGKSTVLALLQRFYDPDMGMICLDKVDIRQLQTMWLRRQMGLVSQEPFLFNNTIRANIEYGVEGEVTEEALVKAAEVANAATFIAGFPKGYESVVGERGVQLSGGQKQRVAIARAMVRDPKIVLLDEATSALDVEAEVVVQEALERAAAGRSTMVVAHRLSTIQNADIIVVLKDGGVAEQGTHDQLMAMKSGIYASLVKISTSSAAQGPS